MPKPDILQLGTYPAWDQQPLEAAFTMHDLNAAPDPAALLSKVGGHVRGIAARGTSVVDRTLISACPRLEIIAVYGVGYDGIDLDAAREKGVRVTNTPDVLTGDVADLGIAMVLALSRRIPAAERWAKGGDWVENGVFPFTRRVHGKRAGILGLGRIGHALARRLAGFEMEIAYFDLAPIATTPNWTFIADPRALAARSDFLFVTLAANDATRHIVGKEVIAALGPEGVVVNISRASNVDEPALLDALESGLLGGAALDVFDAEPRINPRFLALDNVLLQPHHASGTIETRKAMGQLMRDNLTAHFSGQPLLTPVE